MGILVGIAQLFEEHESYQFILDHIDGDHTNNDPDNLQTLCRFCDAEKVSEQETGELNGGKRQLQCRTKNVI